MKKLLPVLTVLSLVATSTGFTKPLLKNGDAVVLIGDSITEQGDGWKDGGYCNLLKEVVPQVEWRPIGFGGTYISGWLEMERDSMSVTNGWLLPVKNALAGKVDVIVIALGMNDILRPTIEGSDAGVEKWIADYRTLVSRLVARCRPRQFVFGTITPLTADPLSPKNIIRKKMNARLRAFAKSLPNAVIADYGEAIEEAIEDTLEIDASYRLVPDFVHPNRLGHLSLAKELCDALDLEDAEEVFEDRIEAKTDEMEAKNRGRINVRVNALRSTSVTDKAYAYRMDFSVCGEDDDKMTVRPVLPAGWTADRAAVKGEDEGVFVIRGVPTARATRVGVEVTLPSGTRTAFVELPAPWRVKDRTEKWLFYSASDFYTGGAREGSIDPYQLYFGSRKDTITAARRVWSEKAREVKAVLSHQTFSATLDISVALDRETVWKENLNRNGKNRAEKILKLKEGWNEISLVVSHDSWQRQFAFELEPLAGDTLETLKYSITP